MASLCFAVAGTLPRLTQLSEGLCSLGAASPINEVLRSMAPLHQTNKQTISRRRSSENPSLQVCKYSPPLLLPFIPAPFPSTPPTHHPTLLLLPPPPPQQASQLNQPTNSANQPPNQPSAPSPLLFLFAPISCSPNDAVDASCTNRIYMFKMPFSVCSGRIES